MRGPGDLRLQSLFYFWSCYIFCAQHVPNAYGRTVIKSRVVFKILWIPERSEYDIKQRQIGIIETVDSLSMMIRMTFWSLHNVTKPTRCVNIRVLKDAEEIRYQQHDGDRLRRKASNKTKANATQNCPADHIERTKEKCSISIESFSTMMHLVKGLPEEIAAMQTIVPHEYAELVKENSN